MLCLCENSRQCCRAVRSASERTAAAVAVNRRDVRHALCTREETDRTGLLTTSKGRDTFLT